MKIVNSNDDVATYGEERSTSVALQAPGGWVRLSGGSSLAGKRI